MRLYVAGPFPMRRKLRSFRDDVQALGHVVTATWVDVEPDEDDVSWDDRTSAAHQCLAEVADADVLAIVTAAPELGRGGRHVELGWALALDKLVWRIGPRSNIFTALADRSFPAVAGCLDWLRDGGAA